MALPGVNPIGFIEPFNQYQRESLTALADQAGGAGALYAQGNNAYASVNPAIASGMRGMTDGDFSSGVERYMNPYTQEVINRTLARQAELEAARRSELMGQQAVGRAGSFGSSSITTQLSDLAKNFISQNADTTAGLNYQGFTDAANQSVNQFNAERARDLQGANAYMNSGNQQIAAGRQGIMDKLNAGTAIQSQNQRALDITGQEILAQRNLPFTRLDQLSGYLSSFLQTGTATGPQAGGLNTLGKLGGLATTLSGAYGSELNSLF